MDLQFIIEYQIFPLLQEYFYGDWARIAMVLGCPYDQHGKALHKIPEDKALVKPVKKSIRTVIGTSAIEEEEEHKLIWSFNEEFSEAKEDEILSFLQPVAKAE
jgi:coenzyme F420-reducing hydrogenase beta subunit